MDDPTCPVGMVRVEFWGGAGDGTTKILYPEHVVETYELQKIGGGKEIYRLYATEVESYEGRIDEWHRPIFAIYMEDGISPETDIWWVFVGEEGEEDG